MSANLAAKVDFKAKQREFASYIKNPHAQPAPADVALQRMATYRELFFNNVNSFLSSGFPVLRKILDESQWLALTEDFFATHQCQTPYFSEIAEEFLTYLQHERHNSNDYPFLLELAHYEWVEMALAIAQVELPPFIEYIENFAQQKLLISPLAWVLAYNYPVHQISPQYLPTELPAQPTYLIVYRDLQDEVHFVQITAMTFKLLQNIAANNTLTVAEHLQQVCQAIHQTDSEVIVTAGLHILQELSKKSIVLVAVDQATFLI